MFTHKISKLPKNTVAIDIKIPKEEIIKASEKAFIKLQGELAVEGFRKGKVPKDLAKKHIAKESIYEEMLKNLLPDIYNQILKKENLKPITNPKISLNKTKENEDWELKIELAEKPILKLSDYRKIVADVKAGEKKNEIWTPGKDKAKVEENAEVKSQRLLNLVLAGIFDATQFEISDLIVDEEIERRLVKLVDDVQKLGLTMEAYLKSKNLTQGKLKEQYRKEVDSIYKADFVLNEIADLEKIQVEEKDLQALFANIKDEKEKQAAQNNAYFYAGLMRKQKTLDFLIGL
ncbi:hypothetical protein AUK04_00800 [Candidatus Roizmanbacteria bacterium CG2_30_33_16]|uniref:Trigger factor n=4 Tax=Candidatus Roizmaniibacteriota TaxID=1752723 RepID=A0A2M7E3Q7_9BACT|nr:hypothetical protein [Candidatus Roizmanbacteria bacterium]OIP85958.1 MAG: hypothetical protein AUK04_00800 [Candidatus Roizmanbacteria bacterium CG2_30_33_16]PIP64235.1 MAG: hypothetical protein COW96_03680 [Candidatus Roizmanbacteria bacterium CG22_combo_CG10-13_8_21_14_all_33_16]PIV62364.1 MAG: hypothetical protein COS12_02675 [Candidatus Roizmanbacteria bacterium CG01_land_8_20_14_3_00_33_9]PJB88164.1 MAG: hypothetical protein CO083_03180 [Candidatus Roizmanbacteria bacterium CG_4_9_14_0